MKNPSSLDVGAVEQMSLNDNAKRWVIEELVSDQTVYVVPFLIDVGGSLICLISLRCYNFGKYWPLFVDFWGQIFSWDIDRWL